MSESIYYPCTGCCTICGNSIDGNDREAHKEWHEGKGRHPYKFKDYTRSGVLERLRDVLDAD
jgi:hypothetical protein